MNGILGNLFNFNKNGKLEPSEQAMEFAFLQKMMEDEEKDEEYSVDELDDFDLMDDD